MQPASKKHSEILHGFALLVPLAVLLWFKSNHIHDENYRRNEFRVTCSAGAQISSFGFSRVAASSMS